MGNNPVFAPALLAGPAGAAPTKNLYVASPVAPFDRPPDLLKEYQATYPGDPTLGVVFGTAAADVMRQILDKACEDGGLAVPLTFAIGTSPSDAELHLPRRGRPRWHYVGVPQVRR